MRIRCGNYTTKLEPFLEPKAQAGSGACLTGRILVGFHVLVDRLARGLGGFLLDARVLDCLLNPVLSHYFIPRFMNAGFR